MATMTGSSDDNTNIGGKSRATREQRLAAELRANLKRRKLKGRPTGLPGEGASEALPDPAQEPRDAKDC